MMVLSAIRFIQSVAREAPALKIGVDKGLVYERDLISFS